MDCNKDEASRAKTLAEEKMKKRDFVGAQKLLMKAQSLFSGLESLPQMLAVCDVHSAAEKKINGLENWYGVLQVMHFDDDATIKKQVRKLVLLLHPDKNQFPGAEAAFKLVWEASVLLADKEKRSSYDIKRRINSRIASLLNENSGQQCSAANNASDKITSNLTFWTCCEHCGSRYKYLRSHVNTIMNCSHCKKSYMAYDTGLNRVPPKSTTGQKEVRNQGPCNTSMNKSGESTGAQSESVAGEVDKKGTVQEKFNKQRGGGKKKNAEVRNPRVEDSSVKSHAESSKPEKGEEEIKNTAEPHKPQPEVTKPGKGASKSVADDSISRNDQASSMSKDKNKRKFVEEATETINVDSSDIFGKADVKVDKKGTVKEKINKHRGGGKKKNAEVRKPRLEDGSVKGHAESSKPEKGEEKIKNTAELHKPQPEVTEPEKGASESVPEDSVSRNDQASSMSKDKNKRRKFVEEPIEIINVDGSDIFGKADVKVDKKGTFKEKINKHRGGGKKKNAKVRKPREEDGTVKSHAESSQPEKGEEKIKNTAELHKPQPEVTEPEKGASKSVPEDSVSRKDQASSMSKDKNKKRKFVEEPIEIVNVDGSVIVGKADVKVDKKGIVEEKFNKQRGGGKKKSEVRKPKVEDGSVKNHAESSKPEKGEEKIKNTAELHKPQPEVTEPEKGASKSVPADQVSRNDQASSMSKDKNKKRKFVEDIVEDKADEKLEMPDPDFSNFELTTNCFAVNQVWSVYDPSDGMPRFYARIEKVLDSEFKLCITWIDPLQDNKDNSIPIACGIFQDGDSNEVDDHLIFSCQMLPLTHKNNIVIYPRKGEIWAIFRGWDISWSASSENYKQPYEYDYVEVLSNFKDGYGLGVAYLGKVEGFVSLFHQHAQHGVLQLQIPPSEILRFSHKVPAFKMTGKERKGVPPGCFELDTAALPIDLFEVDNAKVDVGLDRERRNGKTGGPFPQASKVEVDDLKLRKSPRLTNKQATSRSGQQTAEKKSVNNGESSGQPGGFSSSGEMTTTRNISENINTMGSLRIRKTPLDIHKPTVNPKKRGRNDESFSQSRDNGLLTRSNGSIKCSDTGTHVPSSCKTGKENTFNFENQRSLDKFQVDQIWAIYSNDKGIPRNYAQIKEIDTSPEFKLHVAPLQLYRPPEHITHPVCCGIFKLKTGKAEVLVPSSFSHQVKAVKGKKNRFEVYPGKGEIWALYRNWNTTDCSETEEFEVAEVVETEEQSIQVVPLIAKGFNKSLYERSQESKAGFVDIPKTEVHRFSHQIPAFRHEGRATRFGDGECWELDPKAVWGLNSKNP